ncbi:hypothetical protein FIV50_12700 [Microbacterium foliorum]|uniref:Uncharacterized protein n=1 Tax=Microbacterium foliorum TaxID=104336 RepID=A0A4Y5YTB6_9MICO|nr:hypothetical protein [Microbacterium foliorum]QDE35569.1 hypothetical protein FIV50_12700 [Microbacterium foliorum]
MIRDDISARLSGIPDDDSRLSRLRRSSLVAYRQKFSLPATQLRVDITGTLTATVVSQVTAALQHATALAAKAILDPKNAAITVQGSLLERAPLLPIGQSRGTLYFELPRQTVPTDAVEQTPVAGLTENAVRELIEILPETASDERTLQSLPSRRPQYRSAVKKLAEALDGAASMSLSMQPTGGIAPETSVLTSEQALEVPALLSGTQDKRDMLTVYGILDGMRTRRRLFYIEERGTTQEFSGAIDEDQMDTVMNLVGQQVVARIERLVLLRADGSKSHPSYALKSIAPDPSLI